MDKKVLGQRIKKLRIKRGLSQKELSTILGYKNQSTLAMVEAGINDITVTSLYRYSKALNVSISDLLKEETELDEINTINFSTRSFSL